MFSINNLTYSDIQLIRKALGHLLSETEKKRQYASEEAFSDAVEEQKNIENLFEKMK